MPYEARKDGDAWIVVNTETGEEKARHEPPDAEEKARRQVKLLAVVEKDPAWDREDTNDD